MVEKSRRETTNDSRAPQSSAAAPSDAAAATSPFAAFSLRGVRLPAVAIFQPSFLRFLLLLVGITAGVVGTWNADRHRHVDALQSELGRLERIQRELELGLENDWRWYQGLERDPRVERELLEQFLGPSEDSGIPLERWLAGERPDPES